MATEPDDLDQPRPRRTRRPRSEGPSAKKIGYICFAVGAVGLLLVRGSHSIQLTAMIADSVSYQEAQWEFNNEWNDKTESLQEELKKLRKDGGDQERINGINEELAEIGQKKSEAQQKLVDGEWKEMQRSAQGTRYDFLTGWYLRQWFLVPSIICLAVGLLLVARTGESQESMISMVLLGVLVYSMVVGGAIWGDTLQNLPLGR